MKTTDERIREAEKETQLTSDSESLIKEKLRAGQVTEMTLWVIKVITKDGELYLDDDNEDEYLLSPDLVDATSWTSAALESLKTTFKNVTEAYKKTKHKFKIVQVQKLLIPVKEFNLTQLEKEEIRLQIKNLESKLKEMPDDSNQS